MERLLQAPDSPKPLPAGHRHSRAVVMSHGSRKSIRSGDQPIKGYKRGSRYEDSITPGDRRAIAADLKAMEELDLMGDDQEIDPADEAEAWREFDDFIRYHEEQNGVGNQNGFGHDTASQHPLDLVDNRVRWTYGDPARVVPKLHERYPDYH